MITHKQLLAIIEERLSAMSISARSASIRAVNNPELIRSIKNGHSPTLKNLQKLLEVLQVDLAIGDDYPQAEGSEVPLLGLVGAGNRVAYFNDQIGIDTVSLPNQSVENLAAAEVRGNSMEPVYVQGDILFFNPEDPSRFDIARHIGQDCIVTLTEDSSMLLKSVECGTEPNSWNLHSHNPEMEMMNNQRLKSALAIKWVKRRANRF